MDTHGSQNAAVPIPSGDVKVSPDSVWCHDVSSIIGQPCSRSIPESPCSFGIDVPPFLRGNEKHLLFPAVARQFVLPSSSVTYVDMRVWTRPMIPLEPTVRPPAGLR